MKYVILFAVLLVGCTEVTKVNTNPYINNLEYTHSYVNDFREVSLQYGLTDNFDTVEFVEGTTSSERSIKCSYYYSRTRTYKGFNDYEHKLIVVDVEKWDIASYLNRMDDMYHALSSCVYGVSANNRVTKGQYESLSAIKSPSRYDEKYVNDNWDAYVKELMGAIK